MAGGAGEPVGSARLELISGVALLREEDAVLEAMLAGWARQQLGGRGLSPRTVGQRQAVVRQFLAHAGEYPWNWTAAHLDDWSADLVGVAGKAKSTIRSYHDAIRSFESYLIAPQYRWAEECGARFGTHPARICFESNTAAHLVDYEGRPDRRPMTREELQRFFDYADDQVGRAAGSGRKGALAAYRDATVFKVMYGWGLRCTETSKLDVTDWYRKSGGARAGQVREAGSPVGQGVAGVAAAAAHGVHGDAVGGGGGRGLRGQHPAPLRVC
jgi:integrase/recombinase XerC